ncbi:MAG: DUF423 domain-containing protein [Alphaproteobacteria bacterium]|nr:DUF423 domain-containing protein [Alphaproteobacteria bacterium]
MRLWLGIAAVNGALAVVAGASATHLLRAHLAPDMMTVWETAARYHMYGALAMGLAALAGSRLSPSFFLAGIMLFSASLYALALGAPWWLGPLTPIGGGFLIAGFVCLAISSFRKSS